MNGRIARSLRSRAKHEPSAETQYLKRQYRPTFRFDADGNPLYKAMPQRMAPGSRHLYKSLKQQYKQRLDKKRRVRFFPREGW